METELENSTTLNAIAGVWGIDKGNIIIDGTDITKLSEHKRALFLGRVFQDPMTGTAATMSIEENMAIAARRGQKRGLGWGVTKKEREHYREALKELDLGLEDRLSSKVGLLSGGQRQAITLLMASLKSRNFCSLMSTQPLLIQRLLQKYLHSPTRSSVKIT